MAHGWMLATWEQTSFILAFIRNHAMGIEKKHMLTPEKCNPYRLAIGQVTTSHKGPVIKGDITALKMLIKKNG